MHDHHHIARPFLLLVGLLIASSCGGGQPWQEPGPKDVFDAFLMGWLRGEPEKAFELVLPADREALTASLAGASDLPADARPKPHQMLVVADIENVYDITKMEVSQTFENEPKNGQQVTLTLHHQDGSQSHAELVWSGGRWYVDLPLSPSGSRG